ncbi:MAG TPA: tripartite tricarboxylate transporter substrate binding protein [Burkholderiales bacterium]|nr:tripartite tricarboxylate transporter substrate binding protein [Burkholderiales bacterium]
MCIGIVALASASACLAQQSFPTRPVRIIVGFLPGSSQDMLARYMGSRLTERFGQQIVVDNRAGANGIIGADLAAKATPDGHTLLMMSTSHTMNAAVQPRLPFDPVKSFSPVAMLGAGPLVLVANPSVPASNVKALVELARAKPRMITYAAAGTGGINHFGGALFARTAGIELTHVPYKGGVPALTDVMSGQVQLMFGTMPLTLPQIRAGKVKALGITSTKRSPQLAEVPTIAEAGVPGYEISTWWGVLAPAAVPAAVVRILNTEMSGIITQPEAQQRLEAEGAAPWPMPPAEFARVIATEIEKWRRVAREAHIKPD